MPTFNIEAQTFLPDTTGDSKKELFKVHAQNKEQAYKIAGMVIEEKFEDILGGWTIKEVKQAKRGGYREKAGRPISEKTIKTIAKRIPENLNVQHAIETKALLEDWKERASRGTGPRWEKMKEFLKELEVIENIV